MPPIEPRKGGRHNGWPTRHGKYVDAVKNMSARTSERAQIFQLDLSLAATLHFFNHRAFTHRGTFPRHFRPKVDDGDLKDAEEGAGAREGALSVVGRWNLGAMNIEELLAERRAIHRRGRHEETGDPDPIAEAVRMP